MLPTHLIHVSVTLTRPYLITLLILYYGSQKGQYILGVSPDKASARTPLSDL
jgi:hypothetical protein